MRLTRIAALCVVAVFGTSAATAASASAALPEFTGPFPKTFTATSKGGLLETVGGNKTKCGADSAFGEITGPQNGFMTIVFSKCKLNKVPCNTPGLVPGSIATNLLTMKIYYINKAKKLVGVDLVEAAGLPFLEYGCGSSVFATVQGSVIGKLQPRNKLVTPAETFKLVFKQSLGIQEISNLEGGPVDILETSFGGPFETTGLKSTEQILFTEPVTLIA
jgi:hypothetical protein